eukprot:1195515-Prorocentrum_minimum.AAC.13
MCTPNRLAAVCTHASGGDGPLGPPGPPKQPPDPRSTGWVARNPDPCAQEPTIDVRKYRTLIPVRKSQPLMCASTEP